MYLFYFYTPAYFRYVRSGNFHSDLRPQLHAREKNKKDYERYQIKSQTFERIIAFN